MWTLDFGCVDVRFWFYRRWILAKWMLDFGCLDDRISVVWTLHFGCLDVGFWLFGRWILIDWTLDIGCTLAFSWVDVGSRLFRS